jgi:hypothetical protein
MHFLGVLLSGYRGMRPSGRCDVEKKTSRHQNGYGCILGLRKLDGLVSGVGFTTIHGLRQCE